MCRCEILSPSVQQICCCRLDKAFIYYAVADGTSAVTFHFQWRRNSHSKNLFLPKSHFSASLLLRERPIPFFNRVMRQEEEIITDARKFLQARLLLAANSSDRKFLT